MAENKGSRKEQILKALADELEQTPGGRITTAALAKSVGVSEAALYRHFPSKARMFEGLILFAEETVFARINQILESERDTRRRCAGIVYLMLGFADRNPGITRVLLGDALVGESERLHGRVEQFFARLETQLRQVLREARMRDGEEISLGAEAAASLLLALVEGRLHQFLRTRFKVSPLSDWESQWQLVEQAIFRT